MKFFTLLLIGILFISCSKSNSPQELDASGYQTQAIDGSDAVLATRMDGTGKIMEKGILRHNVKDGIWMTYHDNGRVKSLSSFVDGKLNGTHFEFNNRGQVELEADYLNEVYNGKVTNYKFGRTEQEMNYINGELNGPFVIYSDRGKLQRKGSFKDGKQHGLLQYFDDEENVIMEYQYENGEKISGGIIETAQETTN